MLNKFVNNVICIKHLFIFVLTNKLKTNKMKTLSNIVRQIIKDKNLVYSPKLFSETLEEVKLNTKYINYNKIRGSYLNSIVPAQKKYLYSFMNINLTTDKRLN